jgi:hypothetical protein
MDWSTGVMWIGTGVFFWGVVIVFNSVGSAQKVATYDLS